MQLGFVSAIFGDLKFEEVLRHAADIGYDCVEVMCWPPGGPDRKYGGVMHIDVTDFSQSRADDVRGLCDKHGMQISALGYYGIPLSHEADQAQVACEHLPKVMDAAVQLGLSGINTFVGADHTLSLDDNFAKFKQVWPGLIKQAEERNIRVGIENCPMLFPRTWPFGLNMARTPAIWREMFDVIPSPHFGLNYDPSHLVMQLIDPIAPIREFGSRIFHAHAKDMRIERDKLNDVGSLVPPMERCAAKIPGLGDVDWGKFVGALSDAGFDGPICVEVEDHAFEGSIERRIQSLRISHNVLRPLVG